MHRKTVLPVAVERLQQLRGSPIPAPHPVFDDRLPQQGGEVRRLAPFEEPLQQLQHSSDPGPVHADADRFVHRHSPLRQDTTTDRQQRLVGQPDGDVVGIERPERSQEIHDATDLIRGAVPHVSDGITDLDVPTAPCVRNDAPVFVEGRCIIRRSVDQSEDRSSPVDDRIEQPPLNGVEVCADESDVERHHRLAVSGEKLPGPGIPPFESVFAKPFVMPRLERGEVAPTQRVGIALHELVIGDSVEIGVGPRDLRRHGRQGVGEGFDRLIRIRPVFGPAATQQPILHGPVGRADRGDPGESLRERRRRLVPGYEHPIGQPADGGDVRRHEVQPSLPGPLTEQGPETPPRSGTRQKQQQSGEIPTAFFGWKPLQQMVDDRVKAVPSSAQKDSLDAHRRARLYR